MTTVSPTVTFNFARSIVKLADGTILFGRTVYRNGSLAVWQKDNPTNGKFTRVFFATGVTFNRRTTARQPHRVTLSDGSELSIEPRPGGSCGSCSKREWGGKSATDLLDPDLSSY